MYVNLRIMKQRKIKTVQSPAAQPGFLGAGHTARAVIQVNYKDSDPFILLMDDVLDKKDGTPAGGPHPHAGFETVSLLIEGLIGGGEHQMFWRTDAGCFEHIEEAYQVALNVGGRVIDAVADIGLRAQVNNVIGTEVVPYPLKLDRV